MALAVPHGVAYTPNQVSPPRCASVRDLRLEQRGVQYIRLQFIDYANIVRFRIMPAAYFERICDTPARAMSFSHTGMGLVGSDAAEAFHGAGPCLYVVDLDSFRVCPYAPGHGMVMGWLKELTPSLAGSLACPLCPRTLLKAITDEAQAKAGLKFLAGFESEFMLIRGTAPTATPEVVGPEGYGLSTAHRTGATESTVLDEICNCLLAAGIELQMVHKEAAPGQYEIVASPLTPLEAADALVHTRETIYNVAHKHGLRATLAPRPLPGHPGNGAHVHLSIHSSNPTPAADTRGDAALAPTLTATERSFLQTLIGHLPALSAITLPTAASYARVEDGIWAGGTYACWSSASKEVPVRLCASAGAPHFEVKTIDATSNPYLALAGVLAAGLHGVYCGTELRIADCGSVTPVMRTEEERRAIGLENSGWLPKTIPDARKMLDDDTYLKEKLGADFVAKYLSVNELLEKYMTLPTQEESFVRLLEMY